MLHDAVSPMPLLAVAMVTTTLAALPLRGASQALAVPHPVLDHRLDPARAGEVEASLRTAMAMDPERLLSFLPEWAYARYCECPACYGGVEGNGVFTWSIERPDEMRCRFCGQVWPDPAYPEGEVLRGRNALGEEVSLPYHWNAERKVAHCFSLHRQFLQRRWLEEQCVLLGKAYQLTGKEDYARRVVMVLDRLSRRYPHYPVLRNIVRHIEFRESQEPPYAWDSGRWGCFHNEIPKSMVLAYDLVCESPAFDELSRQRGEDIRAALERDCFRPAFEAVAKSPHHVSNVVGYDIASAALLGRVINDPGMVHRAFAWMKRNLDEGFFRDGMWKEGTPAYHAMTIGGLRYAFSTLAGHSDPPGTIDPVDGTRFDDFDPEKLLPLWSRCLHACDVLTAPNGHAANVHDTHPYARATAPRQETVSAILPAYGHVSLGRGRGAHQMQAQLHFSGAYGHAHADNLNLMLWAKEREMLPDVGYTWTQMRHWASSTLGHNTVVIDRVSQGGRPGDGDLLAYVPDAAGIALAEAEGRRGYGNIAGVDTYRRLVMVVPVSEEDAYVVDLFRVRGGAMHDWVLHGDADADTTAACSLALEGSRRWMLEEGEVWEEPQIEGSRYHPYGMVRDVGHAAADGPFDVHFRYVEDPGRGVRVHVLPEASTEVWLGRSPSVRRMGQGSAGDMRKAYDFWMPTLMVRRQGTAPLASTFVAVEEPFAGAPFLGAVTRLEVAPGDVGAVALQVRHGEVVDTILSTLDEADGPERTAGGVTLRGRLGVVRQVAGRVTTAWLFGGTALRCGEVDLAPAVSEHRGEIIGALRQADGAAVDAFITRASLPAGAALQGAWMITAMGTSHTQGFEIERVEEHDGRALVVLSADHGLRLEDGQAREVFFPRRTAAGPVTFCIPAVTTLAKAAMPVDLRGQEPVATPAAAQDKTGAAMSGKRIGPEWVRVTPDAGWRGRDSMGEVVFRDRLWIFGGWFAAQEPGPRDVWSSADGREWTCVQPEAPWIHGDLPVSLVHRDRMWVMGGRKLPGTECSQRVWSSVDGVDWTLENDRAGWCPRVSAAYAVFKDRMWVLGGTESFYDHSPAMVKNDVWSSADGRDWRLETPQAGWSARAHAQAVVFNDRLWVMGGGLWHPEHVATHDIWSSADGVTWECVTAAAPWAPRLWFSAVVYRGCLWVLGGWSKEHGNFADVWFSRDGRHWEELTSPVAWTARHEHSAYVFKDRLWVAGGYAETLSSEVWSLTLPADWPAATP